MCAGACSEGIRVGAEVLWVLNAGVRQGILPLERKN